jgi:hypothetical protein
MTDPRVQQIREVLESYGDWIVRAVVDPNGTDGMARVQAFVSLDSLVASLLKAERERDGFAHEARINLEGWNAATNERDALQEVIHRAKNSLLSAHARAALAAAAGGDNG